MVEREGEFMTLNSLEAYRMDAAIAADDLDNAAWRGARPVRLTRYWSGEDAPPERHAEARVTWSDKALCIRFECQQHEPLVVNSEPQTAHKTVGLWERDVCEIFIAPNVNDPERYLEFEAAPTGEWLDLAIRRMIEKRETDWEYSSGMSAAARIGEGRILIAMRVPWEAFGRVPQAGERWRANLFRCVGSGEGRGYLAWQPTRTALPNFHVPEAFGWLGFS
jgi:alpha-galactosidase